MEIIIGILGLLIGAGITFVILHKKNSSKANSVLADARKEAEQIKKEYGTNPKLIVSGGASRFIKELLQYDTIYD